MAQRTIFLPQGYSLNLVTDAVSSGTYTRQGNPGGAHYTPVAVDVSADITVGPFNEPRSYILDFIGTVTDTQAYSGIYAATDEADVALLAPKASPTFTGTVTIPTPFTIGAVSMTATGTELNYVDGVTSAIQTQLNTKAATADVVPITNATNVGAVAVGCTVVERGDAYQHTSIITIGGSIEGVVGGAALAVGKLLYTLPVGATIIDKAYMDIAIAATGTAFDADTPDVGLGTTIASGVNAVLSADAAFENILTGQTAADCDGTATVKTVADQILVTPARTVHLNIADTWAAGTETLVLSGTVVIHWQFMA